MKQVTFVSLCLILIFFLFTRVWWLAICLLFFLLPFWIISSRWEQIVKLHKSMKILIYSYVLFNLFVLAIFLRVFIFGIYTIESISMKPTLYPGDIIWLNKLSYGPKLPKSAYEIPWINSLFWVAQKNGNIEQKLWNYSRLTGFSKIKQNDIIVFNHPKNGDVYIKRCVATPGDTIEINRGLVYVNRKLISNPPKDLVNSIFSADQHTHLNNKAIILDPQNISPFIIPFKGMQIQFDTKQSQFYMKIVAENDTVNFSGYCDRPTISKSNTYTFKSDFYFLMGDNVLRSIDSRFFGPVPESAIIGKATFLIFSKNKSQKKIFLGL